MYNIGIIIISFYLFSSFFHFFFYLAQQDYNEHLYYSFFLFMIFISYLVKEIFPLIPINKEIINVLTIVILQINAISLGLFCFSIFDLKKLKKFMIISLSISFFLSIIAIIIYIIKKNMIFQIYIFFMPFSLFFILYLLLFFYQFFKLKQYQNPEKLKFFISIVLFSISQVPISIIKWSINKVNNPVFLISAIPIMILFESGLIYKYKKTENKIKSLEAELKNKLNDQSFSISYKHKFDQFKLTERERQITKLLISGKEAKEISNDLNISYNTVRNFKQKIYFKLQVKNIIELLNFFIE